MTSSACPEGKWGILIKFPPNWREPDTSTGLKKLGNTGWWLQEYDRRDLGRPKSFASAQALVRDLRRNFGEDGFKYEVFRIG